MRLEPETRLTRARGMSIPAEGTGRLFVFDARNLSDRRAMLANVVDSRVRANYIMSRCRAMFTFAVRF